jgi:hypothetical protein
MSRAAARLWMCTTSDGRGFAAAVAGCAEEEEERRVVGVGGTAGGSAGVRDARRFAFFWSLALSPPPSSFALSRVRDLSSSPDLSTNRHTHPTNQSERKRAFERGRERSRPPPSNCRLVSRPRSTSPCPLSTLKTRPAARQPPYPPLQTLPGIRARARPPEKRTGSLAPTKNVSVPSSPLPSTHPPAPVFPIDTPSPHNRY